uniref:Uncharacterized protein n=1 Tax=Ananas comosus var. bracteatus TaxID=296719 RepID=A0A6V7Q6S4_ANACO|nr:unnamed protein product [Ananas comosus var. bracteatus]
MSPIHDDLGLETDFYPCLPLCSFAHACEGCSPQASTPEIAIATHARPCEIGRRNGMHGGGSFLEWGYVWRVWTRPGRAFAGSRGVTGGTTATIVASRATFELSALEEKGPLRVLYLPQPHHVRTMEPLVRLLRLGVPLPHARMRERARLLVGMSKTCPCPKVTQVALSLQTPGGDLEADRCIPLYPVILDDRPFLANLVVLPMENFDVVLGMDWLTRHHTIIDYERRTVTFNVPNEEVFVYRACCVVGRKDRGFEGLRLGLAQLGPETDRTLAVHRGPRQEDDGHERTGLGAASRSSTRRPDQAQRGRQALRDDRPHPPVGRPGLSPGGPLPPQSRDCRRPRLHRPRPRPLLRPPLPPPLRPPALFRRRPPVLRAGPPRRGPLLRPRLPPPRRHGPAPLLGFDAFLSATLLPAADALPTALSAGADGSLWLAHAGQISSYGWTLAHAGTLRTHLDDIASLRRVCPEVAALGSLDSPGLHFYHVAGGRHVGSVHWSDPTDPRVYKARVTAIAAAGDAVFAAFECPHRENCVLAVDPETLRVAAEIGRQSGSMVKSAAPGRLAHVRELGLVFASAVSAGAFGYSGYMRLWDPRSGEAVWETSEPGGSGLSSRFGDTFADADVDGEELAIYKVCWKSGDVGVADLRRLGTGGQRDGPLGVPNDSGAVECGGGGREQHCALLQEAGVREPREGIGGVVAIGEGEL